MFRVCLFWDIIYELFTVANDITIRISKRLISRQIDVLFSIKHGVIGIVWRMVEQVLQHLTDIFFSCSDKA